MKEEDKIELRSEEFQEVMTHIPHWILRWGITVLAIILLILLVGSAIFKYPEIISSQVTLTGSVPPAEIVARSSGKMTGLFVSDNQEIKTGDYLAVIDNPAPADHIQRLRTYLNDLNFDNDSSLYLPSANFNLGNLQSLYSSFHTTLFEYLEYKRLVYYPQKMRLTRERISQYEQQYENLIQQYKLTREQGKLIETQYGRDSLLNRKGIIADEALENSRSQYLQSLLSEKSMQSSLQNLQIQIAQLKESLFDTDHQDVEKCNNLKSSLRSLHSQLITEIQSWELNYVLKSPINGKVSFTNYWIHNQNITAGESVFTIIPTDAHQVIGKAFLPIAGSGRVKIGQRVNIRIDNFPDHEFGILKGNVHAISLVPTVDGSAVGYIVEISLSNNLMTTYKKELPWLPNMRGQADIITDDISLLERFVLPIKKILTEN